MLRKLLRGQGWPICGQLDTKPKHLTKPFTRAYGSYLNLRYMKKLKPAKDIENFWFIEGSEWCLCFSELDEEETGKGYYLQKGSKTSDLYRTKAEALKALPN